jgi:hypothetical protein
MISHETITASDPVAKGSRARPLAVIGGKIFLFRGDEMAANLTHRRAKRQRGSPTKTKVRTDFAPAADETDVEIFLGQCRLLLIRAELGLSSSPANLRNVSHIASQLADSIERVA